MYELRVPLYVADGVKIPVGTKVVLAQSRNFGIVAIPEKYAVNGQRIFTY